jgi:HPt (histidine-containing phosphotransfer) domain-containing protein
MNEAAFQVRIDADLADLIPRYLDNRRQDLRDARDALRIEDYARLQRIGHNIRGSGGGYGFGRLVQIGSRLEQAGIDRRAEQVGLCLEDLADFLHRVEVIYD